MTNSERIHMAELICALNDVIKKDGVDAIFEEMENSFQGLATWELGTEEEEKSFTAIKTENSDITDNGEVVILLKENEANPNWLACLTMGSVDQMVKEDNENTTKIIKEIIEDYKEEGEKRGIVWNEGMKEACFNAVKEDLRELIYDKVQETSTNFVEKWENKYLVSVPEVFHTVHEVIAENEQEAKQKALDGDSSVLYNDYNHTMEEGFVIELVDRMDKEEEEKENYSKFSREDLIEKLKKLESEKV